MKKIFVILFSFCLINYNFSLWVNNVSTWNLSNETIEKENLDQNEDTKEVKNNVSDKLYLQIKWEWVVNNTSVVKDNFQWLENKDNDKFYFKNTYWSSKLNNFSFELSNKINYINNDDILEKSLKKWLNKEKFTWITLWIWFYIIWTIAISMILILISNLSKRNE